MSKWTIASNAKCEGKLLCINIPFRLKFLSCDVLQSENPLSKDSQYIVIKYENTYVFPAHNNSRKPDSPSQPLFSKLCYLTVLRKNPNFCSDIRSHKCICTFTTKNYCREINFHVFVHAKNTFLFRCLLKAGSLLTFILLVKVIRLFGRIISNLKSVIAELMNLNSF